MTATVQIIRKDIGIEFGIVTCDVMRLKGGKLVKGYEIKLESGETIREIGKDGYKHMDIIERDKMN